MTTTSRLHSVMVKKGVALPDNVSSLLENAPTLELCDSDIATYKQKIYAFARNVGNLPVSFIAINNNSSFLDDGSMAELVTDFLIDTLGMRAGEDVKRLTETVFTTIAICPKVVKWRCEMRFSMIGDIPIIE